MRNDCLLHLALHLAIKEISTQLALEIIRVEYNTFLHFIGRHKELQTYNQIFLSLLSHNNNKGVAPIILAAQKGNIPVVQELLRCGVSLKSRTYNGSTAILQAAHFGNTHVIQCFLDFYHEHNES
jgi:ankyrin repeat protein